MAGSATILWLDIEAQVFEEEEFARLISHMSVKR
jgi:hypothetical protein